MMRKWQALSLVMLIFLIGVASGAQGTRLVIRHQIQNAIKKGPAGLHELMMAQLDDQLDLDRSQREKVSVILSDSERDFRREVQPRMNSIFNLAEYRIHHELKSEQRQAFEQSIRQRKQLWSKYDLKLAGHEAAVRGDFLRRGEMAAFSRDHAGQFGSRMQDLHAASAWMIASQKAERPGLVVGPDGKTLAEHINAAKEGKLGDKLALHDGEHVRKNLEMKAGQAREALHERAAGVAAKVERDHHEASQQRKAKLAELRRERTQRLGNGDNGDRMDAVRERRIERQDSIRRSLSNHASGMSIPNLSLPTRH